MAPMSFRPCAGVSGRTGGPAPGRLRAAGLPGPRPESSVFRFRFPPQSAKVTIVMPAPPRSACSSAAPATSGTDRR